MKACGIKNKTSGKFLTLQGVPVWGYADLSGQRFDPDKYEIVDSPTQPSGDELEIPVDLKTELNALFSQLDVAVQAAFYPLKAGVDLALTEGNTAAAKLIIQNAAVPPELADAQHAMLNLFP